MMKGEVNEETGQNRPAVCASPAQPAGAFRGLGDDLTG